MPTTTHVGLDVGSTSIRAVEATASKDRPVVQQFGQIPLEPGAVVGGVVKDRKAVTGALRQLWSQSDFSTKQVALGVTHRQVIVREIDVPNLSGRELRQALPHLVSDVLPLPVDQAILDFYPLTRPGKGNGGTIHGLLTAAPKEAVLDMVHAVEDAGLRVTSIDLACFAALRAAAHLNQDTEALLDIGASGTNIIFHTDGVPKIVRTIPRGGAEITKMLASRLDVTVQEAELVKCRVGLNEAEHPDGAEIAADALRPFLTEIRSSFNYFAQMNPDTRVRRLALVGGAALLPGLPETLTKTLGVPAYLSDSLQRMNDGRGTARHRAIERFRSSATVAIGLTLGAA